MPLFSLRRLRSKSRASNASSVVPDAQSVTVKQEHVTAKTEPDLFVDYNAAGSSESTKRRKARTVVEMVKVKVEIETEIGSSGMGEGEGSSIVQPVRKKRKYVRKPKVKLEPGETSASAEDGSTFQTTAPGWIMPPPALMSDDSLEKGKGKVKVADAGVKKEQATSHDHSDACAGPIQSVEPLRKGKAKGKASEEEKGEKRWKR